MRQTVPLWQNQILQRFCLQRDRASGLRLSLFVRSSETFKVCEMFRKSPAMWYWSLITCQRHVYSPMFLCSSSRDGSTWLHHLQTLVLPEDGWDCLTNIVQTQYKARIKHLAWIWLHRNKWKKKEEIENKGKKNISLYLKMLRRARCWC